MAKVLGLVSFKVYPAHMGGQKGVTLFYEHLNRHLEVSLAVSRDNKGFIDSPFPVHPLLYPNRQMLHNRRLLRQLVKLAKSGGVNCILAEHSYTGWLAYLLSQRLGIPFIVHSHNLESARFRQMQRRWWKVYGHYERWIHQKATHNFFISQEDKSSAVQSFGLSESRCTVIPYGILPPKGHPAAKKKLADEHGISSDYLFHFNGTLDYRPNIEAVCFLLDEVTPRLAAAGLSFTILISGKRLPQHLQERIRMSSNLVYLDFIPDIDLVYQGADLFLNAVINDSGVKTKVVEALANHCPVVSTRSGAAGIPTPYFKSKMLVTPDGDWDAYAAAVLELARSPRYPTPPLFFEYFSWPNIAGNAAALIKDVIKQHESTKS